MDFDLFSEGREYISASRAAKKIGYTSDYLGQLCRANKISGKLVGRTWYVDYASLLEHKKNQELVKVKSLPRPEAPVAAKAREAAPVKTFQNLAVAYEADYAPRIPELVKPVALPASHFAKRTVLRAVVGTLALIVAVGSSFLTVDKVAPSLARNVEEKIGLVSSFGTELLGNASGAQVAAASFFDALAGSVEFFVDGFKSLRNIAFGTDAPEEIVTTSSNRVAFVTAPAEPKSTGVTQAVTVARTEAPVTGGKSQLQTELEAYVRTQISAIAEPRVVYNTFNNSVLRNEILTSDTRPTVTRQSDSDADNLGQAIYALTEKGIFRNSLMTNATVIGPVGGFESLGFGSATGTNATTTNFFSTNATLGSLTGGSVDLSNLLFTNATGTNATSTNSFATTASSTNLFSTNATFGTLSASSATFADLLLNGAAVLQNFTFAQATGTAATTTNFFSTKGTFDELYVNDYQQNDGTFNILSSVTTGDVFSVYDSAIGNGTLIHQSLTANAGNGQVSKGQAIDLVDATTAGGGYSALEINVTGAGIGSGSKTLLSLNPGGNNTVVFDSAGAFRPTTSAASNANSLGSPSYYWKNAYVDTLTANNLSGTVVSGATSNNTWTVGSTEASDAYKALVFQRNSGSGNALFQWNAGAGDARYLSVNYPFNSIYTVDDSSIGVNVNLYSGALTNNTTSGTQNLLSLTNTGTGSTERGIYLNNTGTGTTGFEIAGTWTNGILTNNNTINTGSGNITSTGTGSLGNLLVTGSSTLQNFTFVNATGTNATTTSLFSTTASSTNLFSTNAALGSATISSLTSGRVPFASTGGLLADSASLLWDNTLARLTLTNIVSTNSTSTNATTTSLYAGGQTILAATSGNVGIGTTNPASKLEVAGGLILTSGVDDSIATKGLQVRFDNTNNTGHISASHSGVANFPLFLGGDGFNPGSALYIDAVGNVGINTSSPVTYGSFAVRRAVTGIISGFGVSGSFSDAANATVSIVTGAGSLGGVFTDQNLVLGAGSSEKVRIDSSGNVGIGTTNPAYGSTTGTALSINNTGAGSTLAFLRESDSIADTGVLGQMQFYAGSAAKTLVSSIQGTVAGTSENAGALRFYTKASAGSLSERWRITEDGHLFASTDNTYDIGASGTTRPRNLYVGTSVITPAATISGVLNLSGTNQIHQIAGHNLLQGDAATTYFYGGTSGVQFRKSDNSVALMTLSDAGNLSLVNGATITSAATTIGINQTTFSVAGQVSFVSGILHQVAGHNFFQGDSTNTYLYGGTSGLHFRSADNSTALIDISNTGNLTFATDNTQDIGASAATRPRSVYVGTSLSLGTNPASTGVLRIPNNQSIYARNAANTADQALFNFNSSDQLIYEPATVVYNATGARVGITSSTGILTVGNGSYTAFNSGEIGVSNNRYYASLNAAANNTVGLIKANSSDIVEIGGTNAVSIKLNKATEIAGNTTVTGSGTITRTASASGIGTSPVLRLQNSQGAGNYTSMHFGGSNQDSYIGFLDDSSANTNRFDFAVSGTTPDMTIMGNGNIGIGTTNPGAKLHVKNDADSNTYINVENPNGGTSARAGLIVSNAAGADSTQGFLGVGGTAYTAVTGWQDSLVVNAGADLSGGLKLRSATGGLGLYADGSTSDPNLFVNTTGNVGIGTTNPGTTLEVNGSITAQGSLIFKDANNANTYGWRGLTGIVTLDGGSVYPTGWNFQYGGTSNSALYINSGGSVGIGTTNPGYPLQVSAARSASTDMYALQATGSGVTGDQINLLFRQNTGADASIYTLASISSVNESSGGASGALAFSTRTSGSTFTEKMRITSGGNVGIGMTNPSVALDVTGDVEYTGSLTDVSDERLKENISDFGSGLSIIKSIGVKNYNMIATPGRSETGFIAQNVQQYFPQAVSIIDPTTGYMGVSYVSFIPVLTRGIQELNSEVEAHYTELTNISVELQGQAARIGVLESKVANIEAQLGGISTSTDSSTEGLVPGFLDGIWDALVSRLASAANGIGDFFANRVKTKELCISDENGETCITKAALDALMANVGGSVPNGGAPSGGELGGGEVGGGEAEGGTDGGVVEETPPVDEGGAGAGAGAAEEVPPQDGGASGGETGEPAP